MEDTQKTFEELEIMPEEVPAGESGMPLLETEGAGAEETRQQAKLNALTARRKEDAQAKRRHDRLIMGLMIAVSVLCLGIIGVLIYWLERFFG